MRAGLSTADGGGIVSDHRPDETVDAQSAGAEQLDPSVLGEKPGDDGLPGIEDYPPEAPLGVEDPAIDAEGSMLQDDLAIREWREEPERTAADLPPPPTHRSGQRLDPGKGNQLDNDEEADAIADSSEQTSTPSAEEAALRIDEPPAD